MSAMGRLVSIAAVGASVCVLVAACGGNTSDNDATGGQSATGGRSATGGQSMTGGRSATGGQTATGGVSATGGTAQAGTGGDAAGVGGEAGSGNLDPNCSLPPDSGPCNAAFQSFYFDASSGECLPFTYGGCGGNLNRFDTLGDCVEQCGGGTRCELSSDCVVVPAAQCCAACEPVTREAFVAMHRDDAPNVPVDCDVACGACPDPADIVPTSGNFFAECVENKCVLRDVRETPAAECSRDADCHLRGGSACCESCGDRPVAVSDEEQLLGLLHCTEQACPPCVPVLTDYEASCDAGTCVVTKL